MNCTNDRKCCRYILFELLKNVGYPSYGFVYSSDICCRQCEPRVLNTDMPLPSLLFMPPSSLVKTMSASEYQIKVWYARLLGYCRLPLLGGGLSSNSIESPSDLFSFSYIRNATRMQDSKIGALRSASSRGVKATVAEQVGRVGAERGKDPERGAGIAPHQRMGLGLPMSNIFATWVLLFYLVMFTQPSGL